MMWMRYNQFSIDKLPALSSCLSVVPPFRSIMTDNIEAAIRVRSPKSKVETKAAPTKTFDNGNFKLVLGLCLGLLASCILDDLARLTRRAIGV